MADTHTNKIYPFAAQGVVGKDLLPDSTYQADSDRETGHKGRGRARLLNKAQHQINFIAHAFSQWLFEHNHTEVDITEDLTVQQLVTIIKSSLNSSGIETGARAFFGQPTAPTGWVQDNSIQVDDRMLVAVNHDWSINIFDGHHSPKYCDTIIEHTHKFRTNAETNSHHHHIKATRTIYYPTPFIEYAVLIEAPTGTIGEFGSLGNWEDHSHKGCVTQQPKLASGAPQDKDIAWKPKLYNVIMCIKQPRGG